MALRSLIHRFLAAAAVLLVAGAALVPAAQARNHHRKARQTKVVPNLGQRGSPCVAAPYLGQAPGDDASLDTTSLGAAAPTDYEIGAPTSGGAVKRVMILVHGGGWYTVGPAAMHSGRGAGQRWRDAGWETVNVDYRACGQSAADVLAFYDLIRQQVGPSVPICLEGESAGAHLALMVAADRADVACVIATGAPTNLRSIAAEGKAEAANGTGAPELRKGSSYVQGLARAAFGRQGLTDLSPVTWAGQIHARVLIGTAAVDPMVPAAQAQELAAAITGANPGAYVDVDRLEAGSVPWVHGGVSQAAVDDFANRMTALVKPFGVPATGTPSTLFPNPFAMLMGRLGNLLK
jgi:acetyl esterase/lipase